MRATRRWSCCAAAAPPAATWPQPPLRPRPGRFPASRRMPPLRPSGSPLGHAVNATFSPFTDPALVRGPLYASADRLARRSGALHQARISGRHAGQVITDLAEDVVGPGGRDALVADVGCGRGTTTRMLARRLPAARVGAVDLRSEEQ